jgi:D-serine deaminase-like pyridoxal phosphate-dependent protein
MTATAAGAELPEVVTELSLGAVGTPFALIDGRRLRANIAEMQAAVNALGAVLRPHFKTHRIPAIARLQREAGAVGLTVATPRQLATVSEDLGWPVLVSSLLQVDPAAAPVLQSACRRGGAIFAVDSPWSVELLRDALGPDLSAEVMIEVEAGCMRTGVPASDCAVLARAAAQHGFEVVGVFSYPGHGYVLGQSQAASEQERTALEQAASALRMAGFEPRHISAGSTPTMPHARPGPATEYRPGTYVFGDRQQLTLGAVERAQLSLSVVATVVAVHGDRVVLDAGGKALGRDAPRWLTGFGQLADPGDTVITRLYDHHSVIESYGGPSLGVGDRVSIVPNNANSALALTSAVWMTEDGETARELRPQPDR